MTISENSKALNLPADHKAPHSLHFLSCLIVVSGILGAYANAYHNTFVFDDITLIIKNQFLRSWYYLPHLFTTQLSAGSIIGGSYYRPLQALLYMVIYQFFGLSPTFYHLLNIAFHAANACLVITLGRKLKFHSIAVMVAALVWALHPIHTEPVAYISAVADPLHTFFCLCGLIILLPDFSFRKICVSCVFLVLALLSKENSVVFPLLAASLLYFMSPERLRIQTYLKLWPLAVIVIGYLLIHYGMTTHQPAAPIASADAGKSSAMESFMPFATIAGYLFLLIWPTNLYMEHNLYSTDPMWLWKVAIGFLVLLAIGLQITKKQRTLASPITWGLLWFFAAYIQALYFQNIVYEHWMYMPTIGLFLGLSETVYQFGSQYEYLHKKAILFSASASVAGLIILLGFMTFQQNKIWKNPVTLYSRIIQQGMPAPKAHTNLGIYYYTIGNFSAAMTNCKLAILESHDTQAEAQNNLALTMMAMPSEEKKYDEILAHLLRAVEINPNFYSALKNLASFYSKIGNIEKANIYQERADKVKLQYNPIPEAPTHSVTP